MRRFLLLFVLAASALGSAIWMRKVLAAPNVNVQLDSANVQPRQMEDTTQAGIVRDYKAAWQNLAEAMEQNRADLLDASFVGFAHERLLAAVEQQKAAGLKRKYVDHGHKLVAVFYSQDGSSMQLKDTAEVEVQLMDGSKVVATEPATVHYVVLMTPTETNWKVRSMQAVPSF